MGILVISSAGMLLMRLRRAFLGMCVGACEILLNLSVEQKVKTVSKFKDKVRKIFFTYSLIRQTQTKTPLLRIRVCGTVAICMCQMGKAIEPRYMIKPRSRHAHEGI